VPTRDRSDARFADGARGNVARDGATESSAEPAPKSRSRPRL